MKKLRSIIGDFILIISSNTVSFLGSLIVTTSFFIFMIFLGVSLFTNNHYVGIIGFVMIPGFFVIGLLLVPLGFFLYKKKMGFENLRDVSPSKFMEKLAITKPRGVISIILFLTIVNLTVLTTVGYQSFHYMESNIFCGTLCHKVMNPEYVAYQESPHSRVHCVECHIGSGAGPLIKSKIAGTRQLFSVILGNYHKPIHTPIHDLRPARATCEHCHWPEKFHGEMIRNIINYESDEKNSSSQTTLLMKIGGAQEGIAHGIHRHISKNFKVEYISENDQREKIQWVKLTSKDGSEKIWKREGFEPKHEEMKDARTMDCIDCHNRATHTYQSLKASLRNAMTLGLIDSELPYIRREAQKALEIDDEDKKKAMQKIQRDIKDFYDKNYPKIAQSKKWAIEKASAEIVKIYNRNIHPEMKITWDTYPNHIGHSEDFSSFPGCFRCHNSELAAKDGTNISQDCELCHSTLRYGESPVKEVKDLFAQ